MQSENGEKNTEGGAPDWVNAFIGSQLDALKSCQALPQEDTWLTVPRVQLEEHIQTMTVHVAGKFSELIFNLYELSSANCENY
jgi:hypothetical protein